MLHLASRSGSVTTGLHGVMGENARKGPFTLILGSALSVCVPHAEGSSEPTTAAGFRRIEGCNGRRIIIHTFANGLAQIPE
jgi:predicted molibdopterin-dependent oxidoreductase YjgC